MYPEDTKYVIKITLEFWQILLLRNALEAARGIIMLMSGSNGAVVIDPIIRSLNAFYTLECEKRQRQLLWTEGEEIEPFEPDVIIMEEDEAQ